MGKIITRWMSADFVVRLIVVDRNPVVGHDRIGQRRDLWIDERGAVHEKLDLIQETRAERVLQREVVAGGMINGLNEVVGKRAAAVGPAYQANVPMRASV